MAHLVATHPDVRKQSKVLEKTSNKLATVESQISAASAKLNTLRAKGVGGTEFWVARLNLLNSQKNLLLGKKGTLGQGLDSTKGHVRNYFQARADSGKKPELMRTRIGEFLSSTRKPPVLIPPRAGSERIGAARVRIKTRIAKMLEKLDLKMRMRTRKKMRKIRTTAKTLRKEVKQTKKWADEVEKNVAEVQQRSEGVARLAESVSSALELERNRASQIASELERVRNENNRLIHAARENQNARSMAVHELENAKREANKAVRELEESGANQRSILGLRDSLQRRVNGLEDQVKKLSTERQRISREFESSEAQRKRVQGEVEGLQKTVAAYKNDLVGTLETYRSGLKGILVEEHAGANTGFSNYFDTVVNETISSFQEGRRSFSECFERLERIQEILLTNPPEKWMERLDGFRNGSKNNG
ncbi:MAG: hypothetical protein NUV67_04830 [archaeon]|nr:hypothetical protein [archaeon]